MTVAFASAWEMPGVDTEGSGGVGPCWGGGGRDYFGD